MNRYLLEDKWETGFPIKLGKILCESMKNVISIGCDFFSFYFNFYEGREGLDNKGFARTTLELDRHITPSPHIEYFYKDYYSEREVDKRDHSILSLSTIFFFKLKMNIHGLQEDTLEVVETEYLIEKEVSIPIEDWTKDEEDDIYQRIKPIIECISPWVK